MLYSFYRGKTTYIKANFLQIINMGLVPILCFFLSSKIEVILILSGIINFIITAIFFLTGIKHFSFEKINIICYSKQLLKYGIPRIPGDMALAALFSLPAFFVSHQYGIKTAGFVAFGISLLNMAGAFFGPLSVILLPEASVMISQKKYSELKIKTKRILLFTFLITLFGIALVEIFASELLTIYLGKSNIELEKIVKIVIIGSIGYTVFIVLRSIIDAYYTKAINAINITICFGIFAILGYIYSSNVNMLIIVFSICMILLAITIYSVSKIFKTTKTQ
jgi:O-antigen/teichoic acid export membrane protein